MSKQNLILKFISLAGSLYTNKHRLATFYNIVPIEPTIGKQLIKVCYNYAKKATLITNY